MNNNCLFHAFLRVAGNHRRPAGPSTGAVYWSMLYLSAIKCTINISMVLNKCQGKFHEKAQHNVPMASAGQNSFISCRAGESVDACILTDYGIVGIFVDKKQWKYLEKGRRMLYLCTRFREGSDPGTTGR